MSGSAKQDLVIDSVDAKAPPPIHHGKNYLKKRKSIHVNIDNKTFIIKVTVIILIESKSIPDLYILYA